MSAGFYEMYSEIGRPSIAPEKLLRAQLLQMLYSVRREQLLTEGSVPVVRGMNMDESIWDITVFTKNRDRLLEGDVAREFLRPIAE